MIEGLSAGVAAVEGVGPALGTGAYEGAAMNAGAEAFAAGAGLCMGECEGTSGGAAAAANSGTNSDPTHPSAARAGIKQQKNKTKNHFTEAKKYTYTQTTEIINVPKQRSVSTATSERASITQLREGPA